MAKEYFYQQFNNISQEKFKRRQQFIKRMQSKVRFKQTTKMPKHHHHAYH